MEGGEQSHKCRAQKAQEKQAGRQAAGTFKKTDLFDQIGRWLPDVRLLCSRVNASQPLAWWVVRLGLFARLLYI